MPPVRGPVGLAVDRDGWLRHQGGAGSPADGGQGRDRPAAGRADLHRGDRRDPRHTPRSRSARASRASSRRWTSRRARRSTRASCSTRSTRSPFEPRLAQAKAQLAEAEAQLARAHQDVVRYEPLVAKNAISRQEYETAVVVERAAAARSTRPRPRCERPRSISATPGSWRPSAAWSARPRCIRARWSGAGRARCSRTSRGSTRSTSASASRSGTTCYLRAQARRSAKPRVWPPSICPSSSSSPTASCIPSQGTLVFVDRNVDPATGTILLEAAFPNPGGIVRPGQYARVRAAVDLQAGRDPRAAARGLGDAGHLQRRRGQGRRHHRDQRMVKAGRAHRQPVGHRLRARGRRTDRGRGRAEGPAGHEGQGRDRADRGHRARRRLQPPRAAAAKAPAAQG